MRHSETYTENDNEEEIYISDVVKLKIKIFGDEAQGRVLCGADLVARVLLNVVAMLVLLRFGKRDIGVDVS
jgi:hypothetical protein